MLSAAGGRTPEVWNFRYANPRHGSLVNGNGRESLAEEGNGYLKAAPSPKCNTSALPQRRTVVPLASCRMRKKAVQLLPLRKPLHLRV
jgi:hypothetical protein